MLMTRAGRRAQGCNPAPVVGPAHMRVDEGTDFVMVSEMGRWWRPRRGGCSARVGTLTVLPSRRCAAGLVEIPPSVPEALGMGGDELRVRASLRVLGVEL